MKVHFVFPPVANIARCVTCDAACVITANLRRKWTWFQNALSLFRFRTIFTAFCRWTRETPHSDLNLSLRNFPDLLMGDNGSYRTLSLVQPEACVNMVFGVIRVKHCFSGMPKCGPNVCHVLCVTWLFQGVLLLYLPALTSSTAYFQCSTSMECLHCSFLKSRNTVVLPLIPHTTPW